MDVVDMVLSESGWLLHNLTAPNFFQGYAKPLPWFVEGAWEARSVGFQHNLENSKFELIKRCAEIADSRMFVGFFSSCAPSVTGKILLWTRWSWGHSIPAAYMEWAHVLGADAWSSDWPVSLKSRIMPLKRDNSFPFCASDYFVVC